MLFKSRFFFSNTFNVFFHSNNKKKVYNSFTESHNQSSFFGISRLSKFIIRLHSDWIVSRKKQEITNVNKIVVIRYLVSYVVE